MRCRRDSPECGGGSKGAYAYFHRVKRIGIVAALVLVFLLVAGLLLWPWYRALMAPNTQVASRQAVSLYLRPGATLDDLVSELQQRDLLLREKDFRRAAMLLDFGPEVRPGHYRIAGGLSNPELIRPLRSGHQDPIRLTFGRYRDVQRLSARLAQVMAFDSASMASLLRHPDSLERFGLDEHTVLAAFLPNTYEVWWTNTPGQLLERMLREREQFWNTGSRRAKADSLGLSPLQVAVLASIVEEEQLALPQEWPRIAGLYLNRLRRGMPLEADPTVKFALGDPTLKRLYLKHIDQTADSPYNTYRHAGLPPGPIGTASPAAMDAVLNAENHNYLFLCARADLSGYHAFAATYAEHLRNRSRYTAELNRRGIR